MEEKSRSPKSSHMCSTDDVDCVKFCSDLIRFKTITPNDDGIAEYICDFLKNCGFRTKILEFQSENGPVKNIFARFGNSDEKILGFLGHADVVPPGDGWDGDPFQPIEKNGKLYGRGVCDMKSGLAAFCCAVRKFIQKSAGSSFNGSIEIFITGDEEIGTRSGTQSLLQWVSEHEKMPHDCLIGEPSSRKKLGDRAYPGHRGSLNVKATAHGVQGHVASTIGDENSLTKLCAYIMRMKNYPWGAGNGKFPHTNLEPTLLYTNNYAVNVVPDLSYANMNVRFGDDYSFEQLFDIFQRNNNDNLELEFNCSGEAYYCDSKILQKILADSIEDVVGITPEFSGAGGISDGRFMITHCNIIEFGIVDTTMHQKNENIAVDDLRNLEAIYLKFLSKYFS